jgi:hypothetical protein
VTALLLIVGLVGPAARAGAPTSHAKKAAHRPATKKAVSSGTGDAPAWRPDAKLLSQLQPERQFAGFSMRVPLGFTVEEHDHDPLAAGQITQFLVKGPTRADGTFLAIFVTVGVAAPGFDTGSTDTLLAGNSVINSKEGLTKSEPQDGQTDGLSMTRQYFKYRFDPGSSHWIHGFHYATTDGHTDAMVAAIDAEPYNATSLPLAEAAALTLRRTP